MTDSIRNAVKKQLKKRGMSHKDAAAAAVLSPQYLTDLLSGRRGNLPKNWVRLLDALGLELTVRPKKRRGAATKADDGQP